MDDERLAGLARGADVPAKTLALPREIALEAARELDVIANNMANVGTNGFKARSARFNEFLMPVAKADAMSAAATDDASRAAVADVPPTLRCRDVPNNA